MVVVGCARGVEGGPPRTRVSLFLVRHRPFERVIPRKERRDLRLGLRGVAGLKLVLLRRVRRERWMDISPQ